MPYVADPKIDFKKSGLKALRNFAIMAAIILGIAFATIWGFDALGPTRLEALSPAEVQTRCENAVLRRLGAVASAEFSDIELREGLSLWRVTGRVITEQPGGFWQQRFTCRVEINDRTLGQAVFMNGRAQRIDSPTT